MRINKYINGQRQAKLEKEFPGISPAAAIDILIDKIGEDNTPPATVDNAELTGMKFRIEKLEDRVEELQNNIDAVANELI